MHNSGQINLNMLDACSKRNVKRIFYSSSVCVYPEYNQMEPDNPNCTEDSAYPAQRDSDYGFEKLFSERMCLAYNRNKGMEVRLVRYHNVFGPMGAWNDGREKVPTAMCHEVAMAEDSGEIEVWGEGQQTRSFLYIDECLELTRSDWMGPVNIVSDEMVTINRLTRMVMEIAGKNLLSSTFQVPSG
ncbi:MAG: NAD-dependent epimerase/dehydratase family protein [Syntrophaceae bacterium]|nr:NAD-dependent epimerase/dehydratase family protein [Syntrophaceae bacterium]